ncbi:MAG: NAD-dependent epimerase/dehydratase family protein [Actinobacteria bacterium]|nr:NAD-dependent epimerase/dehydratase family protein [Actinomycetota bacterium]
MKIFVTGAAGQVGSHVVDEAIMRGDVVVGIDNFATGRQEHVAKHMNYSFVEGSISDTVGINRLISDFKPEVIVHTAASYKDPDDWLADIDTNVRGMVNLVEASSTNSVSRFIYFQTALVYGVKPEENPVTLQHPRKVENSSYSISKGAAEDYLSLSGLDYVTFRLANVIGPRNVSGPLPIFFQRLSERKRCFVTPARRDFVYVGDLVKAVGQAIQGVGHGAYHFSSGGDVPIIDLYDSVVKAMGIRDYPEPERRALSPDDAPSILLDPSRTFADFGKINFTPLETTVWNAVKYYQEFGAVGGYTHLKTES